MIKLTDVKLIANYVINTYTPSPCVTYGDKCYYYYSNMLKYSFTFFFFTQTALGGCAVV